MSAYPVKVCEYCETKGIAFTFMTGETICQKCLSLFPSSEREKRHLIYDLRKELEVYRQEETCMCGDSIKSHNLGSGHSPVSMLDYRLGNTDEENKNLKKENKEIKEEIEKLKDYVYGENGLKVRFDATYSNFDFYHKLSIHLKTILEEVHSWIVCAAITTPEDMAQNFERICEITSPEYKGD